MKEAIEKINKFKSLLIEKIKKEWQIIRQTHYEKQGRLKTVKLEMKKKITSANTEIQKIVREY